MKKCNSIEKFYGIIEQKLSLKWKKYYKSLFVLFAYNSTGKTLISSHLNYENTLCYNSFFEDLLIWNNENVLIFNYDEFDSNILEFMSDEGLDEEIKKKFYEFVSDDIAVDINFQSGSIYFYIANDIDILSGENPRKKIKISRAEETIFKFSIFYVLLDRALLDIEENGKNSFFNKYKLIIIDDPTSNLDDGNIIRLADQIANLYNEYKFKHKVKFLIETHNVLFLDILKNNLLNKKRGEKNLKFINIYRLSKVNGEFYYSNIKSSQVAYHLDIKDQLDIIMKQEFISKRAYNLFRILTEKHSTYMGLPSFSHCIRLNNDKDKDSLVRFLNHYSHGNLSEIEHDYISEKDSEVLKEAYYNFINDYVWSDQK